MSPHHHHSPSEELARIIESAERLGVELDEEEALQWLAAIAADQTHDVVVDVKSGVFGHRISMLDFSATQLARFRQIAGIVEIPNQPGRVETALALSGSAAQSKIQSYPGDADFFERVHIYAPTRAEACRILAETIRDKALSSREGPTFRLLEVKFGSYPRDVVRDGRTQRAGSPISWHAGEIEAGKIMLEEERGAPLTLGWEEVQEEPGWCKLDWVVIDPERGQLANASNMLDVTWEAPDGTITPLDGYLDPYFQEVYLEADSIPLFSRLARHVSADALDEYVRQLENEVEKYLTDQTNFGKAAKRMYNVFRLTGRYYEAAFLRELFDEPATVLYQVWSLIRTLDDAAAPGSTVPMRVVVEQADQLILSVVEALEGVEEQEIVRLLLQLRDALTQEESGHQLSAHAEAARAQVINLVNNFFHERLTAVPEIRDYMGRFPRG